MCNVAQNLFDNGDCCLVTIEEHYCHNEEVEDIIGDCVCHEDNIQHPGFEGKAYFSHLFCNANVPPSTLTGNPSEILEWKYSELSNFHKIWNVIHDSKYQIEEKLGSEMFR